MFYQELKHSRATHSPPRLLTITDVCPGINTMTWSVFMASGKLILNRTLSWDWRHSCLN